MEYEHYGNCFGQSVEKLIVKRALEYLFSRTMNAPLSRPIASEIKESKESIDVSQKLITNRKMGIK